MEYEYTLNTGPFDIRPVDSNGAGGVNPLSAQCVDVYVEPPFTPGPGLRRALGIGASVIFDHVSTTKDFTHIYVEVPSGSSTKTLVMKSIKIRQILERLDTYLNVQHGNNGEQELVDSYRATII